MSEPTPTVEERLSALEQWRATTVDPGLGQAAQAIAGLDRRLTKVVNLLKRVGPAIKDVLGIVSTEAAKQDAQLPRDERKRRARTREEVLGSDFGLNGDADTPRK